MEDKVFLNRVLFVLNELGFADNIAIAFLSSIAKEAGFETDFCILNRESLIDKITNFKPKIVGYSANIIGYNELVKANLEAKKYFNFISIMGGPFPTHVPESFNESGMDAYCIGEGEYAFKDFLYAVKNNLSYDDIPNLVTKNKINEVRPLIQNLDELPFPDRDLIIANTNLKDVSKKTFYATRGCPFSCTYCCNSLYNKLYKNKGKIVRRFSVDRLIREIKYVKDRYRMDFVKFGDDLFVAKVDDWLVEFSDRYKKEINVPFNCYLRLDIVTDKMLELLKYAGCFSVHLSVDSILDNVREKILNRRMKSGVNIKDNIKLIHSYGINTWVNFMLGIPESTIENDLDTILFSRECKITYPSYTIFYPLKGTDLYKYCEEKKLLPSKIEVTKNLVEVKSQLNIFTDKQKDIQYNIFLLGAILSKFPIWLINIGKLIIKLVPSNFIFKKIRKLFLNYNLRNKIYKIKN